MAAGIAAVMLFGCGGDGPAAGDDDDPNDETGEVSGRVVISGDRPVVSAAVKLEQLDFVTGAVTRDVGEVVTDADGRFVIPTKTANGMMRLTSSGGMFNDVATGQTIALDEADQLITLVVVDLLEKRAGILISPIGHLIAVRAMSQKDALGGLEEAYDDALFRLSKHFGGVRDWTNLEPMGLDRPATSPTEPFRAGWVLTAISFLAREIAQEANVTAQEVNPYTVTKGWAEDIENGVFDGNDNNDETAGTGIQIGLCPAPENCGTPPDGCALAFCRARCDQYVNTPRSLLGGQMTSVMASELNKTGLRLADVISIANELSSNIDGELFGTACLDTLDRAAPIVTFVEIPAGAPYFAGTKTFKATATDNNVNVPAVSILKPGGGVYPDKDNDTTNATAIIDLDTRTLPNGPQVLLARATDLASNVGFSEPLQMIIDNLDPQIAFDATDYYADSRGWWTAVESPILRGTMVEPNPAAIKAVVGASSYTGTITGSNWSVQIPSGVIDHTGRDVRIEITDLAGNVGTSSQRVLYDATPPEMSLVTASARVFNEASDSVSFAANEDITHAHTNVVQLDVAPPSCPMVTKFSYLLASATASPAHVTETPADNPLLYPLRVADNGVGVTPMTTQYKVIRKHPGGDVVVRDWTAVPTGGNGGPGTLIHNVPLLDGVIAGLASNEGTYYVDFRATDRLQRTASTSRCFELKLRAPPLHVSPGGPAAVHIWRSTITLTGPTTRIARRLMDPASNGAALVEQRFVNATTSTVYLTVNTTRPACSPRCAASPGTGTRRQHAPATDTATSGPTAVILAYA
ncbi:MAG: hypothetical protein WKG01_05525 [Kofleriaceae bacterium]